jgi:hypothetical protein
VFFHQQLKRRPLEFQKYYGLRVLNSPQQSNEAACVPGQCLGSDPAVSSS